MRRPLGAITALLLVFAATATATAVGTETPAAPPVVKPPCVKLAVTANLREALRAAHDRVTTRAFAGPPSKSTYHGRCGSYFYAVASFLHPGVGYTDQPEVFKRRIKQRWRDDGDTGGDLCGSKKVPRSLLRAWKIKCA